MRPVASASALARRGIVIRGAKWLLPGGAVLLLLAVALWPELNRLASQERAIARRLTETDGARMQAFGHRQCVCSAFGPFADRHPLPQATHWW